MNGFSVVFPFVSCMQIAGWSTWTYKHVRQNICLVLCATVWQIWQGKCEGLGGIEPWWRTNLDFVDGMLNAVGYIDIILVTEIVNFHASEWIWLYIFQQGSDNANHQLLQVSIWLFFSRTLMSCYGNQITGTSWMNWTAVSDPDHNKNHCFRSSTNLSETGMENIPEVHQYVKIWLHPQAGINGNDGQKGFDFFI